MIEKREYDLDSLHSMRFRSYIAFRLAQKRPAIGNGFRRLVRLSQASSLQKVLKLVDARGMGIDGGHPVHMRVYKSALNEEVRSRS